MIGGVLKLGLAVAAFVLVGLALFRPATLFGVDDKALGSSVGGEVAHTTAKCVGAGPGVWLCKMTGGIEVGAEYAVRTRDFGCWSGTRMGATTRAEPAKRSVSGCIGLTDVFGS